MNKPSARTASNGWRPMMFAPRTGEPIVVVRDNGCSWDEPKLVRWCTVGDGYPWVTEVNAYPQDRFHYFKPVGEMPYEV